MSRKSRRERAQYDRGGFLCGHDKLRVDLTNVNMIKTLQRIYDDWFNKGHHEEDETPIEFSVFRDDFSEEKSGFSETGYSYTRPELILSWIKDKYSLAETQLDPRLAYLTNTTDPEGIDTDQWRIASHDIGTKCGVESVHDYRNWLRPKKHESLSMSLGSHQRAYEAKGFSSSTLVSALVEAPKAQEAEYSFGADEYESKFSSSVGSSSGFSISSGESFDFVMRGESKNSCLEQIELLLKICEEGWKKENWSEVFKIIREEMLYPEAGILIFLEISMSLDILSFEKIRELEDGRFYYELIRARDKSNDSPFIFRRIKRAPEF